MRNERWAASVLQDEGQLHGDAVLGDLPLLDVGLLLDHVEPGDPSKRLVRPLEPLLHGVLPALRGRGGDLRDARDGHGGLLFALGWRPVSSYIARGAITSFGGTVRSISSYWKATSRPFAAPRGGPSARTAAGSAPARPPPRRRCRRPAARPRPPARPRYPERGRRSPGAGGPRPSPPAGRPRSGTRPRRRSGGRSPRGPR